ncbi:hypothetical protein A2U01_0084958, partial [Trifolium medium]|nr:hypothetical protein [Trifolium medium]
QHKFVAVWCDGRPWLTGGQRRRELEGERGRAKDVVVKTNSVMLASEKESVLAALSRL